MQKLFIILILIFCLANFTSCVKEFDPLKPVFQTKKLIDIYQDLTDPDLDGSIALINYQANFNMGVSDEVSYLNISCIPDREISKNDFVQLNQEKFEISSGSTNYSEGYEVKSYFGDTLTIGFSKELNIRRDQTYNIYIPEPLEVDLSDLRYLGKGYPISWNADERNAEGVYIVIIYRPIENPDFEEIEPDRKIEYINVPDDGAYIFDPADFPTIPEGSLITLNIARGAYVIEGTPREERLRIIGMSNVTGYIKFN